MRLITELKNRFTWYRINPDFPKWSMFERYHCVNREKGRISGDTRPQYEGRSL